MNLSVHPDVPSANAAAAQLLASWLVMPGVRNVMLPGGNTPLELYRLITAKHLPLAHLNVFALDEYVGVPNNEPRNCANLIRRSAVKPWGVPENRYTSIESEHTGALRSVQALECEIEKAGGLDVLVLGLGQNGHLGFNEPGSAEDSKARIVELNPSSVEANCQWFGGDHAPARGATTGLRTLLASRKILLMAYGPRKADAVRAMVTGPRTPDCPASFLQGHAATHIVLDTAAAALIQASHPQR